MDLTLVSRLPDTAQSIASGVDLFLDLLRLLTTTPLCRDGWFTATPTFEGDPSGFDPLASPEKLLAEANERLARSRQQFADWAGYRLRSKQPVPQRAVYEAEYWWGEYPHMLNMDFRKPHPQYGTDPQLYLAVINVITSWQRPMHLYMTPTRYQMNDHPLDRQRNGIGWIGWLPFTLTPADVPEAHLVQLMNGGTVVMTWPAFWQAHEGARNEAAIRRAQDVEIRLNLLGVLPTSDDLAGGNWGR